MPEPVETPSSSTKDFRKKGALAIAGKPTTAERPETLGTSVAPTSVKTKQQLRL
jgi:hypothetical protein